MRIAMLLHKSIEHDSRVRREARALAADGHDVTVLHLPRTPGELDGPLDGYRILSVTPPQWVRRRLPFALYRLVFLAAFVSAARRLRPDAVHAHDAAMLAPGLIAATLTRAVLVYDSHEYAAGVPYRERAWAWLVCALERLAIRRCAAVVTVSDGIADRLHHRYRLPKRPVVVRNVPDLTAYGDGGPFPDLRVELGVPADAPLALHLGAAARDRGCEVLLRALAQAPGVHALFLGADDGDYVAGLRSIASDEGVADRAHFKGSVPIAQVIPCVRQATVGVSLLEPTCENHRLALPNKVFEYVAAGLPVIVSDLPELRRLVERHGIGRVVDVRDPRALARALGAAAGGAGGPEAANAERAGRMLSWATERGSLVAAYESLSGTGSG
ncbi:MAG: glycosyltransferase [Thermoleophilaceae bacterium]